jgi:UMF1 family MFS transporter
LAAEPRTTPWWKVLLTYSIFEAGDSGWSLIVLSLYFGTFMQVVLHQKGSSFVWATTVGALIIAVLSPVLGAAADHSGRRQPYLRVFVAGVVLCTGALFFVRSLPLVFTLFILAYICVNGAFAFFSSMLPVVSNAKNVAMIISMTVGVGYAGNLFTIGAMTVIAPTDELSYRVFLAIAVIYLLVAIPPMFLSPDFKQRSTARLDLKAAYRRIGATLKESRQHKHLFRFLIADFLYENAVASTIVLMGLYARNVMGFAASEVVQVFGPAIAVAMLSAWFIFGPLVKRIGPKRAVLVDLAIWILLFAVTLTIQPHLTFTFGPLTLTSSQLFKIVAAPLAGLGLAGVWSSSRVLMTSFIPAEKSGEFWGLYNLSGRTASVVGDGTVAIILTLYAESTLGYQLAIVALAIYVFLGAMIIFTLPDIRPTAANFVDGGPPMDPAVGH